MPRDWKQWGTRLKRFRQRRGWTQETLADKVGVARVTIARLEIGNRRPSLGLLERIAKTFKVKLSDLLE